MRCRLVTTWCLAVLVGLPGLAVGCAKSRSARSGAGSLEARAQAATIGRDHEAALASMRTDLAATRIAAAKKEAELQELQSLVQQLRQENVESHQTLGALRQAQDTRQAELVALRSERDGLLQAKHEQQFKELKDTVVALTKGLEEMRQGLARLSPKRTGKPGKPSVNTPVQPETDGLSPEPPGWALSRFEAGGGAPTVQPAVSLVRDQVLAPPPLRITVPFGETLWRLARQYRVTVEAIKRANGLRDDHLLVGQRLEIPAASAPGP